MGAAHQHELDGINSGKRGIDAGNNRAYPNDLVRELYLLSNGDVAFKYGTMIETEVFMVRDIWFFFEERFVVYNHASGNFREVVFNTGLSEGGYIDYIDYIPEKSKLLVSVMSYEELTDQINFDFDIYLFDEISFSSPINLSEKKRYELNDLPLSHYLFRKT